MNTLKRGFDSLFFPRDFPTIAKTDEEALASDWKAVGDDMRQAMKKEEKIFYENSQRAKQINLFELSKSKDPVRW